MYATFWDESGIAVSSVKVFVDSTNCTSAASITPYNLVLEWDDDTIIPDLSLPRTIEVQVRDVYGNLQSISIDPHMFDAEGLDVENPSPDTTTAWYKLYRDGDVRINVVNMDDEIVYRQVDEYQTSGFKSFEWDGKDDLGYYAPRGRYWIEIWYTDTYPYEYVGSIDPIEGEYLPLGETGSSGTVGAGKARLYRIWNPTDGKLKVEVTGTAGLSVQLQVKENGRYRTLTSGVSPWSTSRDTSAKGYYYYVRLYSPNQSRNYQVKATLVQYAEASTRSWNGWFWPTKSSRSGPHLYDTASPCPLLKYDQVYGASARSWEERNHTGTEDWEGHCWGWTKASILSNEPQSATQGSKSFTQEEVKGLYCQLYDQYSVDFHSSQNHTYDMFIDSIPSDQGTADAWCQEVHELLYYGIRRAGHAVHMDLTKKAGAIWNYPIYRYRSEIGHASSNAAERQKMSIHTDITAAVDIVNNAPPSPTATKTEWFEYKLWFWANPTSPGKHSVVMPDGFQGHDHDWLESSLKLGGSPTYGYTPRYISWPETMLWSTPEPNYPSGCNPHITKTNVEGIWPY